MPSGVPFDPFAARGCVSVSPRSKIETRVYPNNVTIERRLSLDWG